MFLCRNGLQRVLAQARSKVKSPVNDLENLGSEWTLGM